LRACGRAITSSSARARGGRRLPRGVDTVDGARAVGSTGDQVLKIAARHSQLVNFAWNTDLKVYTERLGVLENHCKKLGVDYGSIRKSAGLHLALKDVEAGEPTPYERYSGVKKWERKTAKEAAEFVRGYVDLGVSHFVTVFPYGSEAESAEYFMEEVAPMITEPITREKTEPKARETL